MRLKKTVWTLVLLGLAACGGSSEPDGDGGTPSTPDGGSTVGSDGGSTPDRDGGPTEQPGPFVPALLFASDRGGSFGLYVTDLDASELREVGPAGVTAQFPALSPDGTSIAFSQLEPTGASTLAVVSMEAGGSTTLETGLITATAPSFSPDGETLVFAGRESASVQPDIYRWSLADGELQRLTTHAAAESGPRVSPDGQHVYFVSNRGGTYEVYRMGLDGSDVAPVTSNQRVLGRVAVSPDGKSLAFTARLPSGSGELRLFDIASGTARPLSTEKDSEPSFSPDGSLLAVTTLRFGDPEVVLLRVSDGGLVRRMTEHPARDGSASFFPDASQ